MFLLDSITQLGFYLLHQHGNCHWRLPAETLQKIRAHAASPSAKGHGLLNKHLY